MSVRQLYRFRATCVVCGEKPRVGLHVCSSFCLGVERGRREGVEILMGIVGMFEAIRGRYLEDFRARAEAAASRIQPLTKESWDAFGDAEDEPYHERHSRKHD